jgi:hypothetical protein
MLPDFLKRALIANYSPPAVFAAAASGGGAPTPVFISAQSLVAFPVASLVGKLLWEVAKKLQLCVPQNLWWPFGISLIVGIVLFLITIDDPNSRPKSLRSWVISGFIGFVNSLFLFAAVIGMPINLPTAATQ